MRGRAAIMLRKRSPDIKGCLLRKLTASAHIMPAGPPPTMTAVSAVLVPSALFSSAKHTTARCTPFAGIASLLERERGID